LITEEEYLDRSSGNNSRSCAAWYYVAQKRDAENENAKAIEAYRSCVEIETGDLNDSLRALARRRLKMLSDPPGNSEK
jgi:hypothetical protein